MRCGCQNWKDTWTQSMCSRVHLFPRLFRLVFDTLLMHSSLNRHVVHLKQVGFCIQPFFLKRQKSNFKTHTQSQSVSQRTNGIPKIKCEFEMEWNETWTRRLHRALKAKIFDWNRIYNYMKLIPIYFTNVHRTQHNNSSAEISTKTRSEDGKRFSTLYWIYFSTRALSFGWNLFRYFRIGVWCCRIDAMHLK